jgi:glycyl-tRNA synthetase beta chain
MAELLLELLSEEIPALMQTRAAQDLERLVCDGLIQRGLTFTYATAFATPRRLTLVVTGIPSETGEQIIERRGPRVGAADKAIDGFLRATGLESISQAVKRDTGKGEFWFAVQRIAGAPAEPSVIGAVDDALQSMPWPKSMRWADTKTSWIRPLHSIVALLDGKVIPVRFEYERTADVVSNPAKYLEAGNATRGHRFLSQGELIVSGFFDYLEKLRAAYVVLDSTDRKRAILEVAQELCSGAQVSLKEDEELLEEVAGLVEWPVPLLGTIDAQFMEVPPEVLIVSMKNHQRYFATTNKDGTLANRFVVVANNVARDGGRTIVEGNERVLRARLSDAKFFWDQDRKVKLEQRLPALSGVVFHAKLGSQADRVVRIERLARQIASYVPGADAVQAFLAAHLCKADLVTGMVGEFPELQGVMGRYYALEENLPAAVADAIGDHYSPAGPNDQCPSAPISIALALADKFDQIFSLWSVEGQPTGSRDPYGLRRAALGVIRIIVENRLRIGLRHVLVAARDALIEPEIDKKRRTIAANLLSGHQKAAEVFAEIEAYHEIKNKWPHLHALLERQATIERPSAVTEEVAYQIADLYVGRWSHVEIQATAISIRSILEFFAERLKVQMRERGVRHDIIDAVFALGDEDDLVRLLARVEALQSFLATEAGTNLLTAYGRAANIVRVEERKDKTLAAKIAGKLDAALFSQDEERSLHSRLADLSLSELIQHEDFVGAMSQLATLREPIDAFFEKVTVNVTDNDKLRVNRLKLLNQIRATMDQVADFSRIEG